MWYTVKPEFCKGTYFGSMACKLHGVPILVTHVYEVTRFSDTPHFFLNFGLSCVSLESETFSSSFVMYINMWQCTPYMNCLEFFEVL